jgi:hypothetical protein
MRPSTSARQSHNSSPGLRARAGRLYLRRSLPRRRSRRARRPPALPAAPPQALAKHQPARAHTRRSQAKDQGDRPLPRPGEPPLARLGRPRSPHQQRPQRRQALRHRPPKAQPAPPPAKRPSKRPRRGHRRPDSPESEPSRGEATAALGRHREPAGRSRDRKSRSLPGVALPARSDAYAVVEVNDAVSEPAVCMQILQRDQGDWGGLGDAVGADRPPDHVVRARPRAPVGMSDGRRGDEERRMSDRADRLGCG